MDPHLKVHMAIKVQITTHILLHTNPFTTRTRVKANLNMALSLAITSTTTLIKHVGSLGILLQCRLNPGSSMSPCQICDKFGHLANTYRFRNTDTLWMKDVRFMARRITVLNFVIFEMQIWILIWFNEFYACSSLCTTHGIKFIISISMAH